jgi:MYXO-CTERM domain-containing protein
VNILTKLALISMLSAAPLRAQAEKPAAETNRSADYNRGDSRDEGREHHNWGWMGLLGLAGLAGLRGRSEVHGTRDRLESQGVNVKTART